MSLDELLSDFVNVIEKIFELQEKKSIKKNPLKEKFQNYQKCLSRVDISEHSDFFLSPFRKNRLPILLDKSDNWIRDGTVHIQFNEGSTKENPKYRIMLSSIYKNALNIAKEARNEFESLMGKEKLSLTETYPQVKYPDLLLYAYYRIVHHFLKLESESSEIKPCKEGKTDVEKLTDIIQKYETHLGIKKGPTGNSAGTPGAPGNSVSDILNSPALGNLFNTGIELMKQNGMAPPSDFKPPSGEEISNMINGFLGNPKIKGFISTMMETMQNSKTPDQLLTGLQNKLGKEGLLQDLMSSVSSSSQPQKQNDTQNIQNIQNSVPVSEIVKDAVIVEQNLDNIKENSGNIGNPETNDSTDLIVTFD